MEQQTIGELISGFFLLKPESFVDLVNSSQGRSLALIIVLVAGISLAIGQGIILFLSRVQPLRFILSLLFNGIIFTFGFLFLVFSIWLNCKIPWWSLSIPFSSLVTVLGASYAPQLFSFLGALPYLGVPILSLLSVWRLLAMVVGFSAITKVSITDAFSYVAIGWVILQLLENTLGRPLASLGKSLGNRIAGVNIVRSRSELAAKVKSALEEVVETASLSFSLAQAEIEQLNTHPSVQIISEEQLKQTKQIIPDALKLLLSLLAMLLLLVVIALVLNPVRSAILGWHDNLPQLFKWIFNLAWIGIIATIFAGILAPLETLGWWAGWYEDELETTPPAATKIATFKRYIIYLDGIGQSGYEYTPDIELFLDRLKKVIPQGMKLIEGLMMYSVLNKPLDQDRPLAFFWRTADRMRLANPRAILGLFLNLRNVLIVAVSADKRYGPIYNLGIAQILYNGLIQQGYQPNSNVPITLIGYSGGGQMSVAAAPYLRQALKSPIEVISLGGVMSANNNLLTLEHLYHLVGDKDSVEKIGPVIFPGRWPIFPLSYWNRAKRRGKITTFSLGPVGHQVPGGMMDAQAYLSDGRSYLAQTLGVIIKILRGEAIAQSDVSSRVRSNYERYQQAAFIQPEYYPLTQKIDSSLYLPSGGWLGRLILPQSTERDEGVGLEIREAPEQYRHLIGRRVKLRWQPRWLNVVTKDVHLSAQAEYSSKYEGLIHPVRLNHWRQVDPLESLAGSRPRDDVMVSIAIADCVSINASGLEILNEPTQVTGLYYALVRFLGPIPESNRWQVKHYDRNSQSFSGLIEVVSLPEVIADVNGCYPSTTRELEQSSLNEQGWYIYGAKDNQGVFVVQSLVPRALLKLEPQSLITNAKQGYRFIREQAWTEAIAPKGKIGSVLISPDSQGVAGWQLGDRALVIHVFGGIGGKKREPAAASPIFFGHFAYGIATVVRDPLTEALRFDIVYHQVYTHNTDGLIAGKLDWSRYMGDRQFGWAGTRPCCDLLIKFEPFTGYYSLDGELVSPLDQMILHLKVMTARYRIGDGTGGTYVGPANNCAQDSNRALFASIADITRYLRENPQIRTTLLQENPEQAQRLQQLERVGRELKGVLQPFGRPRSDWRKNEFNLGCTLEDSPLLNLWIGLVSWRTMLPRCASDNIVRIFLKYGANVWILRTNQIGGHDPDIEAIAPVTI
ncbi:hypothetical protein [Gloeocapsa sp. PCC 73106]|uniref:hypothetical protein n=1 Tax=Gloeocapsa sp. PCC 73106 TaxID=102232 RepID=UPI0002ABBF56|nr:hypothetical protein [Gloeocapsa sp. PCC 73106]ELR96284.1 hypothetical protein GLO73106DRAFT_00000730 [Gloeocapsa sp. PCC 73106]